MKLLRNRSKPAPNLSPAKEHREPVEVYLDALCAELRSILPAERMREVRMETESHLHALILEQQAEGKASYAATLAALRSYGSPRLLGQQIARTMYPERTSRAVWRRRGATALTALCVGLVLFTCGAMLESVRLPAEVESRPFWSVLTGLLCAPMLAGIAAWVLLTGRRIATLLKIECLWLVCALLNSLVMLPSTGGFEITLFLACAVLPISLLTVWCLERWRAEASTFFTPPTARA